jgi:hypothetical protein
MNTKNIIIRLLLLNLLLIHFGCSTDLDIIEKDSTKSEQLITVHKDFEFVKLNKTISKIISRSEKAKSYNKNAKIIQTKDFKIFTNTVTYTTLTDKSRETYSFYIERNNPVKSDFIENLILAKDANNENYRAYIITYFFPNGVKSNHKNFKVISVEEINSQTLSIQNLFAKTACQNTYTYIIIETGHNCYSGEHNGAGQAGSCNGGAKPYSTYSIQVFTATCDGGEGGGLSSPDPTSGVGNNGPISPSTGGSLPVDTGITFPSPCQTDDCSEMLVVNEINDLLGKKLDYFQLEWLAMNTSAANEIKSFLVANNTPDAIIAAKEILNFQMERDWKTDIKQAIANGITSSAELTHIMYSKLSIIATNHPSSINYINTFIDGVRSAVATVIDTKQQTCNWTDLFNMWMFELGSNPMNFNEPSVTVTSLQGQQGVSQARTQVLSQIQSGNLSTVNNPWQYGQDAFYNGMVNGNIATSFLGSYNTTVTITTLPNGQHLLNFVVKNESSWESATRLRIDNDHNNVHDGIFPNHDRNATNTLHIGGNFNQEWTWTETY